MVRFPYLVDGGRQSGSIRVAYPFSLASPERAVLPAVALGVATYIGQLCLAERIELEPGLPVGAAADLTAVATMLYDVRRWMDELPLGPSPQYAFEKRKRELSMPQLDERKAILLFSGGKDSSLAALVLQRNGLEAIALHMTANFGVEEAEQRAAEEISAALGLPFEVVAVEHSEFLALSSRYAINWNDFPYSNRVPFGRDLLLAALSVIPAIRHRAGTISFGHDNECRNAVVQYEGREIPRNDIESRWGALSLESFIRKHVHPGIRMLPPVGGLSEFRILEEMLVRHGDLMARTASCFWGGNCGRCAKCLRYYLAQRVLDTRALEFAVNPLGREGCPELSDLIDPQEARSTLFSGQVVYMLGTLLQRGDVRPDEEQLSALGPNWLQQVAPRLPSLQRELRQVHVDPQVPQGFRSP